MVNRSKNENGYSSIEMLMVMLLLIIFGLGVFMLSAASTTSYESLVEKKTQSEDLRIASSYIVTKLRQNDRASSIRVDKSTFENKDVLIIEEMIFDELYETWIYVSSGVLREATVLKGVVPTEDISFEISKIDSMRLSTEGRVISIGIEKGEKKLLEILVTLKTKGIIVD